MDPEYRGRQLLFFVGGESVTEPIVVKRTGGELRRRVHQAFDGGDLGTDAESSHIFDREEQELAIVDADSGAKAQRLPDLTIGGLDPALELELVDAARHQGVDELVVVVVGMQEVGQRRSAACALPALW